MHAEQFEKLLFQSSTTHLERRAPSGAEGHAASPDTPPQQDRWKPSSDDQLDPDNLAPMKGVFVALVLSGVIWLAVFVIVAWMVM